ncbi:MAG: hypothetical protein MJY62_05175 [Bacteroidales bacterium]|nr:hypothetical protein [Bacteroidales bacterium]
MARFFRRIVLFCVLLCQSAALPALSVKEFSSLVPAGTRDSLITSAILDAVVVSDCRSRNMALNPNLVYDSVDITLSERTAYVQDADGGRGVRLVFNSSEDNILERYDCVRIELCGTVVEHAEVPDCISISGLSEGNIIGRQSGRADAVAAKVRRIRELSDSDIFTFVTIEDLDFACKNGSYVHVYENYVQYSDVLQGPAMKKWVNNRMDTWAALLRDSEGAAIYMPVNSLCLWRKNGAGVPQGTGSVSGIIVNEPNRRYGGNMGPYSVRPVDEQDISVARKRNSPWKCLTAWVLDGSQGQALEFEMLGVQTGVWKNGRKGDKVVSDEGPAGGLLWTDSDSYIHIDNDLTSVEREKNGYDSNGAILFNGPTLSWYDFDTSGSITGTKAFYIEFSPKKAAKATMMQLVFTWAAGDQDGNNCWAYPAQWRVDCCVDGGKWTPLAEAATGSTVFNLRSLPWWDKSLDNLGSRKTPLDCGLGMQTRAFNLPASAIGARQVLLRLSPAGGTYVQPHTDMSQDVASYTPVTPDMTYAVTKIRFGTITIDYK